MSFREEYTIARQLGFRDLTARRMALVNSVIDKDAEQLSSGVAYSEAQARQAAVHVRHDTVLAIAHLDEATASLRSIRRWLILAVLLLATIVAKLLL